MQILIATTNPGKLNFMRQVLDNSSHDFVSLTDVGLNGHDVEETGATYAENALLKAKYFQDLSGLPTIGEDSGIVIDALANELGVKTRRWGAGHQATDQEWIDHFLKRMEAFPEQRGARFISTIVFHAPEHFSDHQTFVGETPGLITQTLEAPILPGIPLSSCFKAEGSDKVYAAMTTDEKAEISHRGKAVKQLAEFLNQLL